MALGTEILRGPDINDNPAGPTPTPDHPAEIRPPSEPSDAGNVPTTHEPKDPDKAPEPKKT